MNNTSSMCVSRIGRHLMFWVLFYCIAVFNELYTADSFSRDPQWSLLLKVAFSELLILLVKALTVYPVLYLCIPLLLKTQQRWKGMMLVFVFVLGGTLLIRITIQLLIWPYVFQEIQTVQGPEIIARFLYSLLALLEVAGLAVAIRLYKIRMQALANEKKLIQEKLELEMKHLKAQLNPHFLFNTLNSIYSLARKQSNQTAVSLLKLSKILRYMLYEAGHKQVLLKKEIEVIEDLIALQQLRFENRIQVSCKVETAGGDLKIIPLVVLSLIENAYKHCDQLKALIEMNITMNSGSLTICVKNTIDTAEEQEEKTEKGLGLTNIERQLKLSYKEYSFVYGKRADIFVVELNINLMSYSADALLQ